MQRLLRSSPQNLQDGREGIHLTKSFDSQPSKLEIDTRNARLWTQSPTGAPFNGVSKFMSSMPCQAMLASRSNVLCEPRRLP